MRIPSSVSTVLLVWAAIITTVNPLMAVVIGAVAVIFQVYLFVRAALD